jgi:hypothetical protein
MIVLGAQANSGDDPPLAHRIVLFEPHRRGPCPTLQVPRHDQGLHPRDRCSCAVPIAIASVVRQAVQPPREGSPSLNAFCLRRVAVLRGSLSVR